MCPWDTALPARLLCLSELDADNDASWEVPYLWDHGLLPRADLIGPKWFNNGKNPNVPFLFKSILAVSQA